MGGLGEKDADRLIALGLVATNSQAGARNDALLAARTMVIIPDDDKPGDSYARRFANRALRAGAEDVRVLTPLGGGRGDGYDVSDFLDDGGSVDDLLRLAAETEPEAPGEQTASTGTDSVARIIPPPPRYEDYIRPLTQEVAHSATSGGCAAAEDLGCDTGSEGQHDTEGQPRGGILNLRSSAEIREMPDPPYLVNGVMPEGVIFQVYGPAGQFKSFLVLDVLLSVANGVPWMGHGVTRAGPVVYVLSEGRQDVGARTRAWLDAHPGCTDDSLLWSVEQGLNLLDGETVESIVTRLPEDTVMVVFDTQQDHMVGGDENSSRDMGVLIEAFKQIRRRTGAIVGTVHHTGWDTSRERGSSAQRGKFDLVIPVNQRVIACKKSKYGRPFEPIRFEMVAVGSSVVPRLVGASANDVGGLLWEVVGSEEARIASEAYEAVLAELETLTKTALVEKVTGKESTVRTVIDGMLAPLDGRPASLVEIAQPFLNSRGQRRTRHVYRAVPEYDPRQPIETGDDDG